MANLVRPITRRDIKGPALYAPIRDDYRNRIIELKKPRRVIVGDRVEIVFDNRLTLTYQIEEICRLENLDEPALAAEIESTNQLMPTADSLAATLFIPLPPEEDARVALRALVGLDEHVLIHIGSHAIRAASEPGRSTDEKISAVQYLRFPLSADAKAALRTPGTPVAVEIDHPAYRHRVACTEELRASLAADYDP
ncbi:MAG TPA: DUF3501 family protein [Kofleriaceae bacterium]|nr:DUF3501 family protein [Kofleriaceae bacterium]